MRNSNKLLALALAAALVFGTATPAFAAEADSGSNDAAAPVAGSTDTDKTDAAAGDEDTKDDAGDAAGDEDKKDDAGDAPAAMNYTDVTEQNWYHGAVEFVTKQKLMDGLTGTTFGPSEKMTRQMLAVALYRLAGSPAVTAENPFTDVADNAAYRDAVVWAYSEGVVNGVTETTFNPDSSIQRQAIATMLARYLKADTSADGDVSAFADASAIQSYAKGAMAWAAANKLLQGDTKGNVDPRGDATRAQVATILERFAAMAAADSAAPDAGTTAPADSNAAGQPADADADAPAGDDNTGKE